MDRELVDVGEASRLTGLAKATLYRLAQEGQVRSFKVLNRALRFDRADLLGLVEERPAVAALPTQALGDRRRGE